MAPIFTCGIVYAYLRMVLHLLWAVWSITDWLGYANGFWLYQFDDSTRIVFNYFGVLTLAKDEFILVFPSIVVAFAVVQFISSAAIAVGITHGNLRAIRLWKGYHDLVMLLAFLSFARTLFGPENERNLTNQFVALHFFKTLSYFFINLLFLDVDIYGVQKGAGIEVRLTLSSDFMTGVVNGEKKSYCRLLKRCQCSRGRALACVSNALLCEIVNLILIGTNGVLCYFYVRIIMSGGFASYDGFPCLVGKEIGGLFIYLNLVIAAFQILYGFIVRKESITNDAAAIRKWISFGRVVLAIIYFKMVYYSVIGVFFDQIVLWHFTYFGIAIVCVNVAEIRFVELNNGNCHDQSCPVQDTFGIEVKVEKTNSAVGVSANV